jgi:polygalacturonase
MRNVFIEGIYREELPMWELHPVLCTNVIIRGVTIDSHGPITMAAIRILPRCAD